MTGHTHERTELLAKLVDAIPVGAVIWRIEDPADGGKLRMVRPNRAASRASGVDLTRFVGMTMAEAFPPFAESGAPDHMLASTVGGAVCELGLVEYSDDNIEHGVHEVSAYRIDDEHLVVQYRNVTTRERLLVSLDARNRELEQAKNDLELAYRQLETFTRVASHDLRAPARQIQQLASFVTEDGQLDTESAEMIHMIGESARDMTGLIDSLLAFARAQSGELAIEDIGVDELLGAAHLNLKARIAEAGADVSWPTSDAVVKGPDQLLRQVFVNIVGNALKFTRPGQSAAVAISVSIEDGLVRFDIADNGVGIPDEQRARIFEPFVRVAGGKYPGTGLGLAFCKELLDRIGGRIDSRAGAEYGTTFSIWVPQAAAT